jgi:hypothetical protein
MKIRKTTDFDVREIKVNKFYYFLDKALRIFGFMVLCVYDNKTNKIIKYEIEKK